MSFETPERRSYRMTLHVAEPTPGEAASRRLVLSTFDVPQGARIQAHIEDLIYVRSDDPQGGPVRVGPAWMTRDDSRYVIRSDNPWLGFVAGALYRDELIGQAALDAVWLVFWDCFVEDDEGLAYLARLAPYSRDFYLRHRLHTLAEEDDAVGAIWGAWNGGRPNSTIDLNRLRAACLRAQDDADFGDAIRSIVAAGEPEGVRNDRVLLFVLQHIPEDV
jgi:hypothetical protein